MLTCVNVPRLAAAMLVDTAQSEQPLVIVRHSPLIDAIRRQATVLGGRDQYDRLLAQAQGRPFILLGECSHGTHEFYEMRAEITRKLILEQGVDAVALEADWPDALRLNRYVQGGDDSLDQAFDDFERFPTWMWRNQPVREFVRWLRDYNANRPVEQRVGVFGLDLYSLHRSAQAVLDYLETVDVDQAEKARRLYSCLDHVRDAQEYGYEAALGIRPNCRDAAAKILVELAGAGASSAGAAEATDPDAQFFAERNAYVVFNAEQYYRAMFGGRTNTWNLRDAHMVNTLMALHAHLRGRGRSGRVVVWAHNSHLGDARATQMGERGEWNVGQLVREQAGAQASLLVGFTTYTGHVTAARDWGGIAEHRWVRPARRESCEHLMYTTGLDRFYLPLASLPVGGGQTGVPDVELEVPRLQRAIGVIYRPESELASHYFLASLGRQFDALFHLDETTAVEPLDMTEHWERREAPDTYPFGL